MACGRIRRDLVRPWTDLLNGELSHLQVAAIHLDTDEKMDIETGNREYGFVLISGHCEFSIQDTEHYILGPRLNPFDEKPYALLVTRDQKVTIRALSPSFLGVGSAPAMDRMENRLILPENCGGGTRGSDNWQRDVRFVIWSDNSKGNMLLMGETITPSGNWSTIPPHRHQYDTPGEEVPYEEAYFFQFSSDTGFALAWQFDDAGQMDQAFSIKANDVLYMDQGYHPVACGPGACLYQLTLMAGPRRLSKSRVHDDFKSLLDEKGMENPYSKQVTTGRSDRS